MPYVIVGDETFPLKPYLLRPYPANKTGGDKAKQHFNYRLSRARRVSENAFVILYQKFRVYNRNLQSDPDNADKIILTTCILHNFIIKYGGNCEQKKINLLGENEDILKKNTDVFGSSVRKLA